MDQVKEEVRTRRLDALKRRSPEDILKHLERIQHHLQILGGESSTLTKWQWKEIDAVNSCIDLLLSP